MGWHVGDVTVGNIALAPLPILLTVTSDRSEWHMGRVWVGISGGECVGDRSIWWLVSLGWLVGDVIVGNIVLVPLPFLLTATFDRSELGRGRRHNRINMQDYFRRIKTIVRYSSMSSVQLFQSASVAQNKRTFWGAVLDYRLICRLEVKPLAGTLLIANKVDSEPIPNTVG